MHFSVLVTVAGKNVFVFDQMVVIFESALAVLVPCGDIHYLREKDQDYDFAVLYDVDL